MTRLMGDATHDNAPALAAVQAGLDIIAGYDTGTIDIVWTSASWALFPGKELVTIDQGAAFSPVPSSTVRDVETGAWTPAAAVNRAGWTATRPTIYCNQSTLPAVLAAGWKGDLWLAIPGWADGDPLPAAPGCTIVAVQFQLDVGGGTYDLSTVIDPYWPREAPAVNTTISVDGLNAMRVDQAVAAVEAAGFTASPVMLLGIAGVRPAGTLDPSEYAQHLVAGASLAAGTVTIGAA